MKSRILIYALVVALCQANAVFGQDSKSVNMAAAASKRNEATTAYRESDFARCATLFEASAKLSSTLAAKTDYYNAACCYGRTQNVDKAFAMLALAVDAGYAKLNHMRGDADLGSLRTDPRWEELLAKIEVPPIVMTGNLTTDPRSARFVYDDVYHFIDAMALMKDGADPTFTLEKEYFGKATPGLKQFIIKYDLTVESIVAGMQKKPEKYEQLGERLKQLKSREESLRQSLVRFNEVVPQAVYPPTYFLVSDYGGVASGSPEGQLITLERRTKESIDRIETILVHELFHFQQVMAIGPDEFYALFGEKKTLLGLTIREGAAEFVANRVTGRITQQDALGYVLEHESEVWNRFAPRMLGKDTSGWMWSKPQDPDQPRDAAYALGLRIVESYYDRQSDKRQAMKEIMSVTDYPALLDKSGYAARSASQPGS